MDVNSVQEVVRALCANFPGFRKELSKGAYRIIVGSRKNGETLSEDLLTFNLPKSAPIHIIPTVAGKGSGIFKIILGVALIAVAATATLGFGVAAGASAFGGLSWGTVGLMGASLAFSGVAQLLTPVPKAPNMAGYERPDDRPSFLLGGQVNTTLQGNPVPIILGRMRTGSLVISAGIFTEKMAVT
ncbi:putative phage tail protein [Skermanella aerolata]|uniref:hypothetical protein n=1 Tax=Skermanella aerolata TaxID=393310 RepID=UPI003D192F6F